MQEVVSPRSDDGDDGDSDSDGSKPFMNWLCSSYCTVLHISIYLILLAYKGDTITLTPSYRWGNLGTERLIICLWSSSQLCSNPALFDYRSGIFCCTSLIHCFFPDLSLYTTMCQVLCKVSAFLEFTIKHKHIQNNYKILQSLMSAVKKIKQDFVIKNWWDGGQWGHLYVGRLVGEEILQILTLNLEVSFKRNHSCKNPVEEHSHFPFFFISFWVSGGKNISWVFINV